MIVSRHTVKPVFNGHCGERTNDIFLEQCPILPHEKEPVMKGWTPVMKGWTPVMKGWTPVL